MKIFKINKEIEIVCNSENTRYGFRHLGTLMLDGSEVSTGKCTYSNRTWERYEFQSCLYEVIRKSDLSKKDIEMCNKWIETEGAEESKEKNDAMLNTISMVAKMGEILGETKKDKNDWKARMIKAGLQNKGLIMPDDWNTLAEDEKERRLNNVIKVMDEKMGDE